MNEFTINRVDGTGETVTINREDKAGDGMYEKKRDKGSRLDFNSFCEKLGVDNTSTDVLDYDDDTLLLFTMEDESFLGTPRTLWEMINKLEFHSAHKVFADRFVIGNK